MMSQEQEQNNSTDNEITVEQLQKELDAKNNQLADITAQFEAVRKKSDELLDETKKAKAKAREEAEAKKKAEMEKMKKNGDFEQLLQSSEKERATLAEQLETLRNKVSSEKARTEAMRLSAELADGSNAELLSEFVIKRLKATEDGIKVLDENGDLTVSSLDDLKREFQNSDKYKSLLRGNRSNGGGAVGNGGSASGEKVTTMDKFHQMSDAEKMAFSKAGGKIVKE